MIHHALGLLSSELEAYFQTKLGANTEAYTVLGNVGQIENENATGLEGRLIISLVNIEEESTLKNHPGYTKTINGSVRYENPPVYLNLYLLFCPFFQPTPDGYRESLARLSTVIEFFQGRHIFNLNNSPSFGNSLGLENPDLADITLILNLYTLTFEQINHLWGSLGGKQIPFAMYKARLVRMVDRRQTGSGVLIEEIENKNRISETQAP
jgi:hypothetical protein